MKNTARAWQNVCANQGRRQDTIQIIAPVLVWPQNKYDVIDEREF
jgi:hypothetical protein